MDAHLSPAEDERELDRAELLGEEVKAEEAVNVELAVDAGEQRVHVLLDAGVEQHALGLQRGPRGRQGGGSTRVVVVGHDVDCGVLVHFLCVYISVSLVRCATVCVCFGVLVFFCQRTLISVSTSQNLSLRLDEPKSQVNE